MIECRYPEATVGALIFNPQGRLFLMKSHKWRGKYCLPGGHIKPGERIEDAVRREVKEETGLDIYGLELVCIQEAIYDPSFYEKRHFIFVDYACLTDSDEVTLNDEAQDYAWVSLDEVDALPVESYTRRTIQEYVNKRRGKRHE